MVALPIPYSNMRRIPHSLNLNLITGIDYLTPLGICTSGSQGGGEINPHLPKPISSVVQYTEIKYAS